MNLYMKARSRPDLALGGESHEMPRSGGWRVEELFELATGRGRRTNPSSTASMHKAASTMIDSSHDSTLRLNESETT